MVPRDASQHGATLHHATQRNVPILYAPRCVTARRTTSPHNTTQGLLIMFKTNAEAARKIDLLCEALETLSPGETITYARLTKVAGEPITGGVDHNGVVECQIHLLCDIGHDNELLWYDIVLCMP